MVASNAPWQLVTTFNEWGEGTAVESAARVGELIRLRVTTSTRSTDGGQ